MVLITLICAAVYGGYCAVCGLNIYIGTKTTSRTSKSGNDKCIYESLINSYFLKRK